MKWFWFPRKKTKVYTANNNLLMMVEEARREMHIAATVFRQAETPLAVDYALHAMDAAERRYVHLLHEAKKQSLSASMIDCTYLALANLSRDPYGRI